MFGYFKHVDVHFKDIILSGDEQNENVGCLVFSSPVSYSYIFCNAWFMLLHFSFNFSYLGYFMGLSYVLP